jgi:hypothetical protein
MEPGLYESVLRVSLADKLHNARALVLDYRAVGECVFERFKTRSAADQLWYYRSLADIYCERLPDGRGAGGRGRDAGDLSRGAAPRVSDDRGQPWLVAAPLRAQRLDACGTCGPGDAESARPCLFV